MTIRCSDILDYLDTTTFDILYTIEVTDVVTELNRE